MKKIFNLFLIELKNKCDVLQSSQEPHSYERMWTQIVYSICMNFKREHFNYKFKSPQHVSPKLTVWFQTDIVKVLQTFVDISQQNGYSAKQSLMKLRETSKSQDTKDIHYLQEHFDKLQNRYHDYVDLLKRCIGTWKPIRVRRDDKYPKMEHKPKHVSGDKKPRFKSQKREHTSDASSKSFQRY